MTEPLRIREAHLTEIPSRTLYLLAKLRQDVFTLEQGATDADLDGRELEPGTQILWAERGPEDSPEPVGHLRILREADGTVHIGRVAVAAPLRRAGAGRQLMTAALRRCEELAPGASVEISAQAYLEQWYVSLGFATTGAPYEEAGIAHVPMRWEGWPSA